MSDAKPAASATAAPPPAPASTLVHWLAFGGCCAIWGSTFLVIRVGNEALAPVWAASVRLMLAALLLSLWCAIARIPWPRGTALRAALTYGALNFGINFPLLYWGEKSVPSGLSAVMYATIPLSTALVTSALGMERLTPAKIVGAVVALGGVCLLFSRSFGGEISRAGLIAVLCSATVAGFSAIALKRGGRQNALAANAVACALGAVMTFVISLVLHESHALPLTRAVWLPLLYLTLAGSLGAFVLFSWLVQRWPVTRTTYVSVVVPLFALALGSLLLHERLSATIGLGSAAVVVGLLIGMRSSAKSAH